MGVELLERFQNFRGRQGGFGRTNGASASWTAAALCRFSTGRLATQSGRGLPQSKTSRNLPGGFQMRPQFLLNRYSQNLPYKDFGLRWQSLPRGILGVHCTGEKCAIIPRGKRRHRFWARDHQSLSVRLSSIRKRRGASLPAAVQKRVAPSHLCAFVLKMSPFCFLSCVSWLKIRVHPPLRTTDH